MMNFAVDVMSASMRVGGFCRSDAGQGQTFGGTAPFLSPHALLTSATAFSHARKNITVPKHVYRLDGAKLATYFTILVRWDEMRAWAAAQAMSWPIEATKQGAYNEFMRVANASAGNDGAWYFSCEPIIPFLRFSTSLHSSQRDLCRHRSQMMGLLCDQRQSSQATKA